MAENRKAPTKPGAVTARVGDYWRITLDDGDVEHMATHEIGYDNVEVGDRVAVTYRADGVLWAALVAPRVGRRS